MPTLSTHVSTDDELAQIKAAAAAAGERLGGYTLKSVRERMRREGHVPGTPEHDIRTEAAAAAELYGPAAVLGALQSLRAAHGTAA